MRHDNTHRTSVSAHGSSVSFDEALRDHIRSAPWIAISAVAHAILFMVLAQFPWSVGKDRPEEVLLTMTTPDAVVDPIEPPEVPPPPEPTKIERDEPVEDPVVTEEDFQAEVLSDQPVDSPIDAPFMGKGPNDVLGVGGGGGGRRGGGSKYGQRTGGKHPHNESLDLALEWLGNHQSPLGNWSCEGFSSECKTNLCSGSGDASHDVGVTGLSMLAFLGAGHYPNHGKYQKIVRRGLRYLESIQDAETGCFGEPNSHQAFLYDHALATLAMTEGYGLSGMPMLKEPAQAGIRFIQAARAPYGAWRYSYPFQGKADTSVTGWMVMALKSAEDFGLRVEEAALDGARTFLDEMTDDQTWRTGYLNRGSYPAREPGFDERWPETRSESLTAVAMLCRMFLGEDPDKSPALRGGADLLRKLLPTWDENEGTIDYYYWYYGSYAMYQLGGKDWDVWQRPMVKAVVKTQRMDGDERGSWDPEYDPWGHRGGRVYSTAIMALTLEVYYRYDRVLGGR